MASSKRKWDVSEYTIVRRKLFKWAMAADEQQKWACEQCQWTASQLV